MKNKVAIFCGGRSLEHEISILTAFDVLNSMSNEYEGFIVYIDKDNQMFSGEFLQEKNNYKDLSLIRKKAKRVTIYKENNRYYLKSKFRKIKAFDVAYLCVHGKGVEDGVLAAFMEFYDIPYVSSGVLSSSIGQDKWLTKYILHSVNVPVLPCFYVDSLNYDKKYIEKKVENIGFPLIVKSNHLGSSIGLKKVNDMNELYEAIDLLRVYDSKILIEKYLTNFKEINQALTIQNNEFILSKVEIIYPNTIFDYENKYLHSLVKKEYCEEKELIAKTSKLSKKIYSQLGFSSIARIDYLYDLDQNKLYFSEVNTIPGSISRKLFEANQILFDELINGEIQNAISNSFIKKNRIRVLENNIMKDLFNVKAK